MSEPQRDAEKPTLLDVIDRLDRLEAALHQLIDAVRGQAAPARPFVAPPAAPGNSPGLQGTAAAGEPPLIQVAPPVRGSAQRPPAPLTTAAIPNVPEAPAASYDPYAYRTDIQVPGAGGSIQQVLQRVFEAGLTPEPEDTWAIMTKLTHPSQMVGPRALDHFKAFNWHKLRRTAQTYLRNGDPATFQIAYTDPSEVTPEVDRVRVFIRAGDNRMPVPVGFARDPAQGNAWRVTMISL